MKEMFGINSAVMTPFDSKGNIDYPALKEHVDFLIGAGVHNLYPLGTTGECFSMTLDERKAVAEKVMEYAGGRVEVFVHVGTLIPSETVELARHAESIGAAGVGAITPYYYGVSQKCMYDFYKTLSESVSEGFPIYIYNLPGCTCNDILPDTIMDLSKLPNIAGVKNTMGDIPRLTDIVRKADDDFVVIIGEDAVLYPALCMGAKGGISGCSNMFPELFVGIYEAYKRGDHAVALAGQKKVSAMFEVISGGVKPCCMKAVLEMRGFRRSYSRAPQQRLLEQDRYDAFQAGLKELFSDEGYFA